MCMKYVEAALFEDPLLLEYVGAKGFQRFLQYLSWVSLGLQSDLQVCKGGGSSMVIGQLLKKAHDILIVGVFQSFGVEIRHISLCG